MLKDLNICPLWFLLCSVLLLSCTNNTKETKQKIDGQLEQDISNELTPQQSDENIIFYNIFSPIDANNAWKGAASYYNSSLINPLNNITKYQTSNKIALNLGVYGADLSYLWMFNQNQQGLSYLSAVQRLSATLGIPNEFVKLSAQAIENNAHKTDSMLELAQNAYYLTDQYLNKSNRANAANLILLGGWIESLYIATNMYDEPDALLASKIATQKFSLYSLCNLLKNNQDELVTKEYLLLLDKLKAAFNRFEIKFQPNNITIDTVQKRIRIKENEVISLDPSHFKEIKHITSQIRKHIID